MVSVCLMYGVVILVLGVLQVSCSVSSFLASFTPHIVDIVLDVWGTGLPHVL